MFVFVPSTHQVVQIVVYYLLLLTRPFIHSSYTVPTINIHPAGTRQGKSHVARIGESQAEARLAPSYPVLAGSFLHIHPSHPRR